MLGNALANAKIAIEGESSEGTNIKGNDAIQGRIWDEANWYWCLTSAASEKDKGEFGILTIQPENYNLGYVKIGITEIETPENCLEIPEKIWLTINYEPSTGKVKSVEVDKKEYQKYFSFDKGKLIIKNEQIPPVKLSLHKTDTAGNSIAGIKFLLKVDTQFINDDNGSYIWTTDSNGNITFPEIERVTTDDFCIDIYEETVYYEKVAEVIKKILSIEGKASIPGFVGLKNPIRINFKYVNGTWEATLNKNGNSEIITFEKNAQTNTIEIKVENKSKIDKLKLKKTDSLTGQSLKDVTFDVKLENIDNYNSNNWTTKTTDSDGEITFENLVIKDVKNPIKITLKEQQKDGYKKLDDIVIELKREGEKYNIVSSTLSDAVSIDKQTITLNIKNIPIIKLSGKVWLDGQQGEKVIADPNGKIDANEEGVNGVKVHLFSVKDNKIIETIKTSNGGTYEFTDIPKTAEGYKVQFEYNGILYDDVGIKEDSKAAEDSSERNVLNDKFKTINKEGANGSKYGEKNATEFKSYVDGSQPAGAAITAYTKVYTETTAGINCGLTEKYFDLAVGTDLNSATVAINGKTTNYTYAQVLNGELQKDLQAFQGVSANTEGIKYNLYLYQSDYNYRISDYKTDTTGGIANKVNPDDSKENAYDKTQELEVYVTYSVVLKNQSKHEATITKFEYIYDEAFEPYNIASTEKYDINIDKDNRKITFTSKDNGLSVNGPDYRNQIDLTFKVGKNDKGVILKENYTNTVEILEYTTTEGGLIDIDSVPGNGTNNNEDDYDKAPALNIAIDTSKVRTIGGTVFEDANKNGNNDDNKPVNDVIVQLIELKTIKGKYYEYIWQETRSGSNKVKTTSRNGYAGTEYTSDASGEGTYKFKDFIPGNYIIRFIYGDGSTYDIETDAYKNSADNVKKYNGQEYKSTIDNSYKEEWYNPANYNGKSTARDNEARRLEVMAYSTKIDKEKGEAIKNKAKEMLDATWMCAETSKVNVEVDGNNNSYENMNFGLALRPQTKLTLEKHITGLKITPQGTGVQPIVDAKVVNGEIQGITTGLARIDSTITNRGFWKVETDIEELAQGATVELEYTYTIKNNSDEDYLTEQLINAYENPVGKTYDETLLEIRDTIKQQMRNGNYAYSNNNTIGQYLGQYYYKQEKNDSLKPVLSTVNIIEDNLNNNLKLVEETNMNFEKSNSGAVAKTVYDDEGKQKTENIETVIRNKETTGTLPSGATFTTTVKLTTTLSSSNKEISYPTYIGEIVEYTNAAGRKDMEATPENLSYVHSEDKKVQLESYIKYNENKDIIDTKEEATDGYVKANEHDEFWGETLLVSKPTGENKQTPMQIVIIAISSVAVIGVGIILVKKFVLKK